MAKNYQITLGELDLGQLLGGLEARMESWERTAEYLRDGCIPDNGDFLIEECSDVEEAEKVAEHFRSIIDNISKQMEAQNGAS
ncbi:hypothetical protein JIN84_04490 [Luteolibacter yonseiensis]|uniref:Uncharacterized protein n=1 Tax=Luteolibacter yonseiensis TaxID=1144680 RepID=A0A934R3L8_9BACT|nr:hypothetical protein [Luteolibacter yonseiensis]MBK1814860.1 hypothetical protein [Luteolibacter yonseiensis]